MNRPRFKRTVYPRADPIVRRIPRIGRPLIRNKTGHEDERVAIANRPLRHIHNQLRESKYERHTLLSTLKYLDLTADDRVWEISSWAYWPEGKFGEWQHHCYVITVGNYNHHIYHHKEKSFTKIRQHQNAAEYQTPGDPDGHLADALDFIDE